MEWSVYVKVGILRKTEVLFARKLLSRSPNVLTIANLMVKNVSVIKISFKFHQASVVPVLTICHGMVANVLMENNVGKATNGTKKHSAVNR